MATHALLPHPLSQSDGVDGIGVTVLRRGHALALTFAIRGSLDELRIPSAGEGLPAERLWAHTCCEVFVGQPESSAYVEWNFSPSGQSAQFNFIDYRQRIEDAPTTACTVHTRREEGCLVVDAVLALPEHLRGALQLALTAVVEDAEGTLSYWALTHATERPDFHDRRTFVLPVPAGAS